MKQFLPDIAHSWKQTQDLINSKNSKMKKTQTPDTTKQKKPKLAYKVSTNMADNDYFTYDEQDAKNKFQTYIADYGDGIRLYEGEVPKDDTDPVDWEIIDSYDEDDFEEAEPTKQSYVEPVGFKGTQGEWTIQETPFDGDTHFTIDSEQEEETLANICKWPIEGYEKTAQANAKLISQSKEIAKALQDMINEYCQYEPLAGSRKDVIENAKQVLKQAGLTE